MFNKILGIEPEINSQPKNLRSPPSLKLKDNSVSRLSEVKNSKYSSNLGSIKATVRNDPDYIDYKSMDYHRKIVNRAQEIEDAMKNNNKRI